MGENFKMEPLGNIRKIIEWEDLDPNYFKSEAKALVSCIERGESQHTYWQEKLRHLEELKELFCRAEQGRDNKSGVRACLERLRRKTKYD